MRTTILAFLVVACFLATLISIGNFAYCLPDYILGVRENIITEFLVILVSILCFYIFGILMLPKNKRK